MQTWIIIVVLALGFVLQTIMSYAQMKRFSKEFIRLRRIGRVAIGKRPGRVNAGTVVLFAIDGSGTILEGSVVQGVTVFARCKHLTGYEGKNISTLSADDYQAENKLLQKAIANAVFNYNTVMSGKELPKSHTFFQKIGLSIKNAVSKNRVKQKGEHAL